MNIFGFNITRIKREQLLRMKNYREAVNDIKALSERCYEKLCEIAIPNFNTIDPADVNSMAIDLSQKLVEVLTVDIPNINQKIDNCLIANQNVPEYITFAIKDQMKSNDKINKVLCNDIDQLLNDVLLSEVRPAQIYVITIAIRASVAKLLSGIKFLLYVISDLHSILAGKTDIEYIVESRTSNKKAKRYIKQNKPIKTIKYFYKENEKSEYTLV